MQHRLQIRLPAPVIARLWQGSGHLRQCRAISLLHVVNGMPAGRLVGSCRNLQVCAKTTVTWLCAFRRLRAARAWADCFFYVCRIELKNARYTRSERSLLVADVADRQFG